MAVRATRARRHGALDRELLRDRDGHRLFNRRFSLVDLFRVARVSTQILTRRAAVVGERGQRPTTGEHFAESDYLVHTFSSLETAEMGLVARKLSVRLNDLLLRDYFLMLANWNRAGGEARWPIRVLVPTNLRRKEDYRMPAANVFGYAFLSRRIGDADDRTALLASVRQEMGEIKRTKYALYHEAGMRLFCLWLPMLKWNLKRDWPFATAIFSNLNGGFDHLPLPWRNGRRTAGDLVVEAGHGVGPIRPDTRVAVSIHTYAGRLSVCFAPAIRTFSAPTNDGPYWMRISNNCVQRAKRRREAR